MALSHRLLASALLLLPLAARGSAQQQGKPSQGSVATGSPRRGRRVHPYRGQVSMRLLSGSNRGCLSSRPTLSHWESLDDSVSRLCAFPGCSVSNSNPSVYENNPPGYVVATIHVESDFTVTIDPSSSDAGFFAIEGSELQLIRSVDYEVSFWPAGRKGGMVNEGWNEVQPGILDFQGFTTCF